VPNLFIHSTPNASPKYTQSPVSSLGLSKERAQLGVIIEESYNKIHMSPVFSHI